MLNYLLLSLVVVLLYLQNILNKKYSQLAEGFKNAAKLFNLLAAAASLIVFAFLSFKGISLHKPTLVMSTIFAVGYFTAVMFLYLSINSGPLSLTALIFSYSLLIPAMFGVVVLGERLKIIGYVAIVFLIFSLYLINTKSNSDKPITKKWLIFITLATIGNGVCSSIQKYHQELFPAQFRTEFMLFALVLVVVAFAVRYLLSSDKKEALKMPKTASLYPIAFGVANALVNVVMLIISSKLRAVIIFPIISGGGIVLTFLSAIFIFKEKLSTKQYIGSFLGLIAVILLSI